MGRIVCVSGAAGHGKTRLLSLLRCSDDHKLALWLTVPTLKLVQEALNQLQARETLVIDECPHDVFEHIKFATYDGFVIVALMA